MNVPLHVKAAIVCDDIRQEQNGKLLAIGIYAGDILLDSFPASLILNWLLLAELTSENDTVSQLEVRIAFNQDTDQPQIAMGKVEFQSTPHGSRDLLIKLPNVGLQFTKATDLILSVKEGDEWREVSRMQIRLKEPTVSSIAPSQP